MAIQPGGKLVLNPKISIHEAEKVYQELRRKHGKVCVASLGEELRGRGGARVECATRLGR